MTISIRLRKSELIQGETSLGFSVDDINFGKERNVIWIRKSDVIDMHEDPVRDEIVYSMNDEVVGGFNEAVSNMKYVPYTILGDELYFDRFKARDGAAFSNRTETRLCCFTSGGFEGALRDDFHRFGDSVEKIRQAPVSDQARIGMSAIIFPSLTSAQGLFLQYAMSISLDPMCPYRHIRATNIVMPIYEYDVSILFDNIYKLYDAIALYPDYMRDIVKVMMLSEDIQKHGINSLFKKACYGLETVCENIEATAKMPGRSWFCASKRDFTLGKPFRIIVHDMRH